MRERWGERARGRRGERGIVGKSEQEIKVRRHKKEKAGVLEPAFF